MIDGGILPSEFDYRRSRSSEIDDKPLALSPTPSHSNGDVKEPTSLFDKSRGRSPRCVVWPFHSFTSNAMGWVGNEINNGRQTFPVGTGTSFLRYNCAFCAV